MEKCPQNEQPLHSAILISVAECIKVQYPRLQTRLLTWGEFDSHRCIEITRTHADIPGDRGGPITVAAVLVDDTGSAQFKVAGQVREKGNVLVDGSVDLVELKLYLESLRSSYVFCNGICPDEFKKICSGIRYSTSCLEELTNPFLRLASPKCLGWYPLRFNASQNERRDILLAVNRCTKCNEAYRVVRKTNRKNVTAMQNPDIKLKRVQHDSHYPLSLLSPASKKKRLANQKTHKFKLNQQLEKHQERIREMTIELSEEQSDELGQFVSSLNAPQLQDVFKEIEDSGGEGVARTIREAFYADQKRNSK